MMIIVQYYAILLLICQSRHLFNQTNLIPLSATLKSIFCMKIFIFKHIKKRLRGQRNLPETYRIKAVFFKDFMLNCQVFKSLKKKKKLLQ